MKTRRRQILVFLTLWLTTFVGVFSTPVAAAPKMRACCAVKVMPCCRHASPIVMMACPCRMTPSAPPRDIPSALNFLVSDFAALLTSPFSGRFSPSKSPIFSTLPLPFDGSPPRQFSPRAPPFV